MQFAAERAAFLNGQFGTTGWWWYFPYAFAVKTTIPGMIVGLFALAALVVRWKASATRADPGWQRATGQPLRGTPLLALVSSTGCSRSTSNLNIGHRHLLPIYPALCILAGGAAFWIQPLSANAEARSPDRTRAPAGSARNTRP